MTFHGYTESKIKRFPEKGEYVDKINDGTAACS